MFFPLVAAILPATVIGPPTFVGDRGDMGKCIRAESVGGFIGRVLRKRDIPACFILSWIGDAIVVTLYRRHGVNPFNGLGRRDWFIFRAATVVSNLFWSMTVVSVIEVMRLVF